MFDQHKALLGRFDAAAGPSEDGVLAAVDEAGAVRLDLAFSCTRGVRAGEQPGAGVGGHVAYLAVRPPMR